jgi:general secretion pathway protein G
MLKKKSGFTLVEILIVVIILGILAAIVIPQFTGASQEARASSLVSQLQTLRSQILLYKMQHADTLPNLLGGSGTLDSTTTHWDALTTKTVAADGRTYGPYMQAPPKNPLNNLTNVVDGVHDAAAPKDVATCGFLYDYAGGLGSGRIWGTGDTAGIKIYAE